MENLIQEGMISFETGEAFYNPRMKLNRDISVAMTRTLEISDYLDALSASGIRGIRASKEAGVRKVTLNDVSPQAHEIITKNMARNGVMGCEATCSNANVLMHQRHFQAVDLDPFGSPSPFLSAGVRSALSYLFVTATDTAPLCGAHLKSGIRKYMAVPLKTDYHREMGARMLLGLIARELARRDKSMQPLLIHATEHYVRTYLRIEHGAKSADKCLDNLGYIDHCKGCGSFFQSPEPKAHTTCPNCGLPTSPAGPLWLGKIQDKETIAGALKFLDRDNRTAVKLLETCASEIDFPMYYDHHRICRRLGVTPAKVDDVVKRLQESGYAASRTHFSGVGIKTEAGVRELEKVL